MRPSGSTDTEAELIVAPIGRHRELGLTDSEYDSSSRGWAASPTNRARRLQPDVVGALRIQALQEALAHRGHRGAARGDGAGAERRAVDSAAGCRAPSRSSPTTTRAARKLAVLLWQLLIHERTTRSYPSL